MTIERARIDMTFFTVTSTENRKNIFGIFSQQEQCSSVY